MGLDMYLNAKRYVSSHRDEDKPIAEAIEDLDIPGRGSMRVKWIECEAIYWRKANHIHQWFVDNVQDGEDECRAHDVDLSHLKELRDLCRQVLEDRSKAPDLLPTQAGFFFGSLDYDEGYFEDTKYTAEQIDKLLATPGIEEWYFEYQSSW